MSYFLLLLVFQSWMSIVYCPSSAQERDRELFFPAYYFFAERRLMNHTIETLLVKNLDKCEYLCYMNDVCVSLNIKNPDNNGIHECELNNSTHMEHDGDLVDNPIYYYRGAKNNCGKSGRSCENNATCHSGFTPKGYRCFCAPGFEGEQCEKDIDECYRSYYKCHVNATCANTKGSYNCSCNKGYFGDGQNCTDIDECATGKHDCNDRNNFVCSNTNGSFICLCADGLVNIGGTCEVDGCQNYQNLSDAERKVTYKSASAVCDANLVGWYRFQAAAGTKMATTCPTTNQKCGVSFQAWLSEPHPTVTEGQTRKQLCINKGNDCCYDWFKIQVKNCSSYYVYKLHTVPTACNFRYCGTD